MSVDVDIINTLVFLSSTPQASRIPLVLRRSIINQAFSTFGRLCGKEGVLGKYHPGDL